MYCHAELWPGASDLAARLGVAAVLLWSGPEEGGAAFEEAVTIDRLPATAAKPFLSATVELRGRADVDPALARRDARALYELLADRDILADPAIGPRPAWQGPAVRHEQVVNVTAPALGALYLEVPLGVAGDPGPMPRPHPGRARPCRRRGRHPGARRRTAAHPGRGPAGAPGRHASPPSSPTVPPPAPPRAGRCRTEVARQGLIARKRSMPRTRALRMPGSMAEWPASGITS